MGGSRTPSAPVGVRVLLGDDVLLADAIHGLLPEAGLRPVTPTEDGGAVALLDVALVGGEGLARTLPEHARDVPVVLLVDRHARAHDQLASRLGALGCVSRRSDARRLVHDLAVAVRRGSLPPQDDDGTSGNELTVRETQIVLLLGNGKTNKEIGEALGISTHTARTHVQNVMAKLGVSTRLAAAAAARSL